MLRLVCLSDTHGLHRQIVVPHGDVLIIAGDLTRHGEPDELPDLNDWLGACAQKRDNRLRPSA